VKAVLKDISASYAGAHREAPMHRYTAAIDALAIGVGILILGAMVADPATVPAPAIATTITSQVSPFDLMVKAKDLPVQRFAAI
jgi:hypothetical protein